LEIIWPTLSRKLRPTRISTVSISRIAAATLIATGKNEDSAPIATLEPGPTPNHMISSGKKMIFGVGPR
jgi:hypothetical protein